MRWCHWFASALDAQVRNCEFLVSLFFLNYCNSGIGPKDHLSVPVVRHLPGVGMHLVSNFLQRHLDLPLKHHPSKITMVHLSFTMCREMILCMAWRAVCSRAFGNSSNTCSPAEGSLYCPIHKSQYFAAQLSLTKICETSSNTRPKLIPVIRITYPTLKSYPFRMTLLSRRLIYKERVPSRYSARFCVPSLLELCTLHPQTPESVQPVT